MSNGEIKIARFALVAVRKLQPNILEWSHGDESHNFGVDRLHRSDSVWPSEPPSKGTSEAETNFRRCFEPSRENGGKATKVQHRQDQGDVCCIDSRISTNTLPEFEVNGTGIPQVDFDIGESYAGTLAISENATDENRLFFWFFPSDNPEASDEISKWLGRRDLACHGVSEHLDEHHGFTILLSDTFANLHTSFVA